MPVASTHCRGDFLGLRGPGAFGRRQRLELLAQLQPKPRVERAVAIPAPMSSGAARVRRFRERRKQGQLCVMVELDADDLEVLVEAGLLDGRTDCHNREVIAGAVRDYLRISRNA